MPGDPDSNQFRFSSQVIDENKILMRYRKTCERFKT